MHGRIFYSAAAGPGNPVIYVGAKTGRDGIHGATMASAEFSADAEAKRPTVQVGDPFTEKLLIEACLELMAGDAIVAIQDMGAAGLTSSSVEMAGKGGLGIALDLDRVPVREAAHDRLRDHALREPGAHADDPEARARGRRRGASSRNGSSISRSSAASPTPAASCCAWAARSSPTCRWARSSPRRRSMTGPGSPPPPGPRSPRRTCPSAIRSLRCSILVGCPDLASKRWIWEQYDHLVMGQTVQRPGGDAAVVRIPGRRKALALSTDCTPRYCHADARARRRAGGGRELAQPHRRRRHAARHHRQHEFRQSRAAGDHGPVRAGHRGHARGLPCARLSRRLRQCIALQRDRRQSASGRRR